MIKPRLGILQPTKREPKHNIKKGISDKGTIMKALTILSSILERKKRVRRSAQPPWGRGKLDESPPKNNARTQPASPSKQESRNNTDDSVFLVAAPTQEHKQISPVQQNNHETLTQPPIIKSIKKDADLPTNSSEVLLASTTFASEFVISAPSNKVAGFSADDVDEVVVLRDASMQAVAGIKDPLTLQKTQKPGITSQEEDPSSSTARTRRHTLCKAGSEDAAASRKKGHGEMNASLHSTCSSVESLGASTPNSSILDALDDCSFRVHVKKIAPSSKHPASRMGRNRGGSPPPVQSLRGRVAGSSKDSFADVSTRSSSSAKSFDDAGSFYSYSLALNTNEESNNNAQKVLARHNVAVAGARWGRLDSSIRSDLNSDEDDSSYISREIDAALFHHAAAARTARGGEIDSSTRSADSVESASAPNLLFGALDYSLRVRKSKKIAPSSKQPTSIRRKKGWTTPPHLAAGSTGSKPAFDDAGSGYPVALSSNEESKLSESGSDYSVPLSSQKIPYPGVRGGIDSSFRSNLTSDDESDYDAMMAGVRHVDISMGGRGGIDGSFRSVLSSDDDSYVTEKKVTSQAAFFRGAARGIDASTRSNASSVESAFVDRYAEGLYYDSVSSCSTSATTSGILLGLPENSIRYNIDSFGRSTRTRSTACSDATV
jgi:hypothetical protein